MNWRVIAAVIGIILCITMGMLATADDATLYKLFGGKPPAAKEKE